MTTEIARLSNRGRKLTRESYRISKDMVKRYATGQATQKQLGDEYGVTNVAVGNRIAKFAAQFPTEYGQIVAKAQAAKAKALAKAA